MTSWKELISPEMAHLGHELAARTEEERKQHAIFPPQNKIFRALTLTAPDNMKAVIIGQDPYHTPGAADGLAFSVGERETIPPSLRNIFKELRDDLGCDIPKTGELSKWAENGVLLLNRTLTVQSHKPNSHADWGWHNFTKHIFDICISLPQPIVFILWGKFAQQLAAEVTFTGTENKRFIASAHPSPLSAYKGFFGSRPFSKANQYLISMGSAPVDWRL